MAGAVLLVASAVALALAALGGLGAAGLVAAGLPVLGAGALLRGSLRAAGVVRWGAVFALGACGALLYVVPFLQPFSLTFAQLRVGMVPPWPLLALYALVAVVSAVLAGLLGRAPVRAAQGGAHQRLLAAALAGTVLMVGLGIAVAMQRGGAAGAHARALAQEQGGSDLRYHVQSLERTRTGQGTRYSAVVLAWSQTQVNTLPVQWVEP